MLADFAITKPTVGGSSGTWGTELNAALDVLVAHPGIKVVADADAKAAYVPLLGQVILQADTGVLYKCTNATGPVWAEIGPAATADSTLTTKGDLLVYGSALSRLGVGTDGQVLTADSGQTLGVKWAAASGGGGGYPAYNPDAPPSVANAMDDEFDGVSLDARWSWANQSTSSYALGDMVSLLTINGVNNAEYRCLAQAVPVGSWIATTKVHFGGNFWADAYAALVILPATDGGIEALAIGKDGTNAETKVRAERWTNWTTFGEERKGITYGPTHVYFRIYWDATASKAKFSLSSDGVAWADLINWTTLSITPGRVGVAVRGTALPQYFEFFRVT